MELNHSEYVKKHYPWLVNLKPLNGLLLVELNYKYFESVIHEKNPKGEARVEIYDNHKIISIGKNEDGILPGDIAFLPGNMFDLRPTIMQKQYKEGTAKEVMVKVDNPKFTRPFALKSENLPDVSKNEKYLIVLSTRELMFTWTD